MHTLLLITTKSAGDAALLWQTCPDFSCHTKWFVGHFTPFFSGDFNVPVLSQLIWWDHHLINPVAVTNISTAWVWHATSLNSSFGHDDPMLSWLNAANRFLEATTVHRPQALPNHTSWCLVDYCNTKMSNLSCSKYHIFTGHRQTLCTCPRN